MNPAVPALLRASLTCLSLVFVLGGGCTFIYSDNDHDDDDDDDDVIIVVDNDTSGAFAATHDGGMDPAWFRFGETLGEAGLSPTRWWGREQVGDRELAAFAATVLLVNEERLALGVPADELQYLDTRVDGDTATVLFGRLGPAREAEVGATYDRSGRLLAIDRLADDRDSKLR